MTRPPARTMLILPPANAPAALARALAQEPDAACAVFADADEADALKALAHPRDVALLIVDDVAAALALGLDGAHLRLVDRDFRGARAALGEQRILGAFCGVSRHAAMTAGDLGADYVAFGPCDIGEHAPAAADLLGWWQEVMEPPCVAWAAPQEARAAWDAAGADFVALSLRA